MIAKTTAEGEFFKRSETEKLYVVEKQRNCRETEKL